MLKNYLAVKDGFCFVQVLVGQPDISLSWTSPRRVWIPVHESVFWEIIAELKKAGKTIIYSSHYIEEVEYSGQNLVL